MVTGIGTTHFMSGLRKHILGGHKMDLDFKKAKGHFRSMSFKYFQFPDLYRSCSRGTDACMVDSTVLTEDQLCVAIFH